MTTFEHQVAVLAVRIESALGSETLPRAGSVAGRSLAILERAAMVLESAASVSTTPESSVPSPSFISGARWTLIRNMREPACFLGSIWGRAKKNWP